MDLFAELPDGDEQLLFRTPRGYVWQHRNFYRAVWRPAQIAAGTRFTLYDARQTFSSRLLTASIPLVEVAAWMGHSLRAGRAEVNTTSRTYAHATEEHREAALGRARAVRADGDPTLTVRPRHSRCSPPTLP